MAFLLIPVREERGEQDRLVGEAGADVALGARFVASFAAERATADFFASDEAVSSAFSISSPEG